jgi:hypothetical protein
LGVDLVELFRPVPVGWWAEHRHWNGSRSKK